MRLCTPSVCLSVPLGTVSPKPKLTETSNLAKMFPSRVQMIFRFWQKGQRLSLDGNTEFSNLRILLLKSIEMLKTGYYGQIVIVVFHDGLPPRVTVNPRMYARQFIKCWSIVIQFRSLSSGAFGKTAGLPSFFWLPQRSTPSSVSKQFIPPAWIINKRIILAM